MVELARRHHYVPQFYLAGFTPSGGRDDQLWVLDMSTGRRWQTGLSNIAVEKDFYRVEMEDEPPDAIEKLIEKIETLASPILRKTISTRTLPEGEDLRALVTFIALLSLRVPHARKPLASAVERLFKLLLRASSASEERWGIVLNRMRNDGVEVGEEVTYEQFRAFVESDRYGVQMPQDWFLKAMLNGLEPVAASLLHRTWSLIIAAPSPLGFVCSDNPVALDWTSPVPRFFAPGFAAPDTEVIVPLNARIVMLGRFEEQAEVCPASEKVVAALNSRIGKHADRYLYHPHDNFEWLATSGEVRGVQELLHEFDSQGGPEQAASGGGSLR